MSTPTTRLGSHCPQLVNENGLPTLVMPDNWHGIRIEETIVPGDAECGPQYTGVPMLSFFISGEVRRWYRSGAITRVFDNTAPGFDIYGAKYERDFGKWLGKKGTSIRISLPLQTIQNALPEQSHSFDLETVFAKTDHQLRSLVLQIFQEIKDGCPNGILYAEGLSLSIIGWLNKHYSIKQSPHLKTKVLSAKQQKVIRDYINAFLGSELTVDKMAHQLAISPTHFAVLFRSTFNLTPHQYVLKKRLNKAAELLKKQQETSILDVAIETGFSSQSHLTYAFKRYLNQTPGRWKKGA